MCTLSFVPGESGYTIAMNRDEQLSRPRALPPAIFGSAICPHERSGGTWIAVNTAGLSLALLNRNAVGAPPAKLSSRGQLIPALISANSLPEVHRRLIEISLKNTHPFRLFGFSFQEREFCEWTWGTRLTSAHFNWQYHHWYSSGISDTEAAKVRTPVVDRAWKESSAGSSEWLRKLHKSHEPQAGAFSLCVHRPDAQTVSYSEIVVGPSQIEFHYAAGSPCVASDFDSVLTLPANHFIESTRA